MNKQQDMNELLIIEDGIHDNISIEDYHANTSHISATQIKKAKESLKHFDWYVRGKLAQEKKSHFDFGNAFELALLDPKGYLNSVAVLPDQQWVDEIKTINEESKNPRNTNYYKDRVKKFHEENAGKYVISDAGEQSFDTIEEMLSSCLQDSTIQALVKNTEYQLSLFWTDPETGLKLKTRPDICKRKKNVIVNLKTTTDGSPKAFGKTMVDYDYPLQACIEMMGCTESGLMDRIDNYFWLVVEKVPPFNATIYEFADSDIKVCMDSTKYHLNKIAKGREQNSFPGYTQEADNEYGILTAELPKYYRL